MTNLEVERRVWLDILRQLEIFEEFREFLNTGFRRDWDNFIDAVWGNGVGDMYADLSFKQGYTKAVIISDNCNYVLKVSFSGESCDYCAKEKLIYDHAKDAALAHIFAETHYGFYYCGRNFYLQEMCDCDEYIVSEDYIEKLVSEGTDEEVANDMINDQDGSETVEDLMRFYYGIEAVEQVIEFLEAEGSNDWHMGNVGYSGDKLVFTDFSGYIR